MEGLPSSSSVGDEDDKNLEQLYHTFGSVVSLEDIAAAYWEAGRNLSIAGDTLCNLPEAKSTTSRLESHSEDDSMETTSTASLDYCLQKDRINLSKPKRCAASTGIVPNVTRREYDGPKSLKDEASKPTKPLKLNSDDIPFSELWKDESSVQDTEKTETLGLDVEEFLFKMLGDGFSLDISTIHDVVGQCGYDVNKSMDKLMDMSAATLGKCDDIVSTNSEKLPNLKSKSSQCPAGSSSTTGKGCQLAKKGKSKYEVQKEILGSLFVLPGRFEDAEIIPPPKVVRQNRNAVAKPLRLPPIEHRTVFKRPSEMNDDEEDQTYEVLRKAVKEYWAIMKEYYKAAFEAYVKKDHARAYSLLDEGNFFRMKAREADEKSAKKLIEPRSIKDEVILDIRHFDPKDAVRFLKLQLNTYTGITSLQYLKVIVGVNEDDPKGRRKRLIMKLLEGESIAWSEQENGRTLVIKADEINPKMLSFFKRPTTTVL
ncbi:unnamed protein product [Cuscuta campestris]|uniref:DUF1771 domain-containing protein n=1 Tax=Cuscuta campestris TaxID=132261 RepID=A0A484MSD8_9ASTE|nr:unnamed protein product [Cuscuta campestris]